MMGSLKLSKDGRAQLKAPCHWESIVDDIADIKAYIETEATNHDNVSEIRDAEPIDIHLEKRYMDEWVAAWLGSRHHTRIIVHWPTFQFQYNKFWESQSEADDAWLAMLVSMASMGALLTGHSRESRKDLEAAEFLRRLAAHVLIQTNVSVVRPCLIEALLKCGTSQASSPAFVSKLV
ncbi:hypothetical protein PRZ48_002396 [Zasmidium cellare]|uniref:Uncharacterized protein n=1 Tax=Zasmidium cellare TaxID=395010 RepID=A0ABR0F4L9_ZASCE|nr:hypothetical protein PRZ48_002396 [Zasmidium cellare]